MEIFCTDIHGSITGALIFAIPNGHLYCTALLKATCCFQPPSIPSQSLASSPSLPHQSPSSHVKPSIPSSSVRATKTHGEPSSGAGHVTTTNSSHRRTADSACSSDGAVSPPNRPDSSDPSERSYSRHGSGTGLLSRPWKGAVAGAGAGSFSSSFRPPQSQGIPIAAGSRRTMRRRSSGRTNSFGGSAFASPFSPFSAPGSFLRSTAIVGSRQSSLKSWSIWNPESFDSRFGRDAWGDNHSSVAHSLRSWVFVNEMDEADLSGMCKCRL